MPARPPERKLFDGDGFYAALDSARIARKLKWKDVAGQAGISASTLTRMAQGRRPDVDSLAALCRWASLDAQDFMGGKPSTSKSESGTPPLAMISTYLRSDPNLKPEAAEMLDDLIKITYKRLSEG